MYSENKDKYNWANENEKKMNDKERKEMIVPEMNDGRKRGS